MTYRDLLEYIKSMNDEQLNQDVTVLDAATVEFYPVEDISFADNEEPVLDAGHPFMVIRKGMPE